MSGTRESPKSYAHAPRLPPDGRVDVHAVLPGSGPLLLEIGSGRGQFAMQYVGANPTHRVLAFEIRLKYAAILADRLAALGPFARCFADDARLALPRLDPAASVNAVAIHFPDPWWKKRHAKRLVVGDVLLAELERLVAPGGVVFVQTDVEDRAREYLAQFTARDAFENIAPAGQTLVGESPFAPARSNRESRSIADGLPIYRIAVRRRG